MLIEQGCRAKEGYSTPVDMPSPSPTSTMHPGAPYSQHCCIYYENSCSNPFSYPKLLISRIF